MIELLLSALMMLIKITGAAVWLAIPAGICGSIIGSRLREIREAEEAAFHDRERQKVEVN